MLRTARKIYEQFLPLKAKESEYISEYKEEYYEVLSHADEHALFMCKCVQRHYEEVMKF